MWEMVSQTLLIPATYDSLNFYMGVSGNSWHDRGQVWIMDADSVGTYFRLFRSEREDSWAPRQVNISAWAGRVVTIYFAGYNYNGYWDHQCQIYFDDVYISEASSVPPTVPQNVTVSISGGLVTLNWDFVTGETYNIYSSTDPYAADWGAAIATGIEVGNWSESVPGVDTFYRVTATR